jgi:hypothetical protein
VAGSIAEVPCFQAAIEHGCGFLQKGFALVEIVAQESLPPVWWSGKVLSIDPCIPKNWPHYSMSFRYVLGVFGSGTKLTSGRIT